MSARGRTLAYTVLPVCVAGAMLDAAPWWLRAACALGAWMAWAGLVADDPRVAL